LSATSRSTAAAQHAIRALRPDTSITFTIGIISDTHGLLRLVALRALPMSTTSFTAATSAIPRTSPRCGKSPPLTAIRGNVDTGQWATEFAETECVRLAGRSFYALHDLNSLQIDPVVQGVDVIVSGHSHVPKINMVDGLLYVNPGSAGRRRFKLPITLASLEVTPDGLKPIIHDLEVG
jgi:uncharacterized protein